jgi:peptidoglycan/LPS O-acetylase OafA/YrhL
MVSYAAYLWNYIVILWLNGGSTADLPPLVAVAAIVLTLLIAVLSWHTVERLGRTGRNWFDSRSQQPLAPVPTPALVRD